MRRISFFIVVVGLVASACTGSSGTTPTTIDPATNTPLTTLPPAGGSTSTSSSPTTTVPAETTTTAAPLANDCAVRTDTSVEEYDKSCTVLDITLRTSEDVPNTALEAQADRVFNMLVHRPDLVEAVIESSVEGRVIGQDQRMLSLPEYTEFYELYPGYDWARRGRSFPGTELVPYFAGAEENLLCLEDDFYEGEDNFVRAFALTIRTFGLDEVDETTSASIDQAYGQAIAQGLWVNTLAEINSDEYWAEGVQSFFDANLQNESDDREPNSSHNAVDTRDELQQYDPSLWAIAASVFGDGEWRPSCG